MLDHIKHIGPYNTSIEIQDRTDESSLTVDLWIGGNPATAFQIPWAYTLDGVRSDWQNYNHLAQSTWQKVATLYVGYGQSFTWHIGETGGRLGPATDYTVDLFRGSNTKSVSFKDGDTWKRAIPFVKVDGVWKAAAPFVMLNSEWKEAT